MQHVGKTRLFPRMTKARRRRMIVQAIGYAIKFVFDFLVITAVCALTIIGTSLLLRLLGLN